MSRLLIYFVLLHYFIISEGFLELLHLIHVSAPHFTLLFHHLLKAYFIFLRFAPYPPFHRILVFIVLILEVIFYLSSRFYSVFLHPHPFINSEAIPPFFVIVRFPRLLFFHFILFSLPHYVVLLPILSLHHDFTRMSLSSLHNSIKLYRLYFPHGIQY